MNSEISDGSGCMKATCTRPEIADNVMSGEDIDTFRYYACVNLWVAIFSNFSRKSTSAIHIMRRRRLVHLNPIVGVKDQTCITNCDTENEALNRAFQSSK